jgi:hypothetical protein
MSIDYSYDDYDSKKYTQEQLNYHVKRAVEKALLEKPKPRPKQEGFVFESQEIESIYKSESTDRAAYKVDLGADERNRRAESRNQMVVFPKDDELQIDIDSEHAYDVFNAMRHIVTIHFPFKTIEERPSYSGLPKRHIVITLENKVTPHERLILQLALGSDRVREVLGLRRLQLGQDEPTCFFEPKPEGQCLTTETTNEPPTKPSLWNTIKGLVE